MAGAPCEGLSHGALPAPSLAPVTTSLLSTLRSLEELEACLPAGSELSKGRAVPASPRGPRAQG